jgi:CHAD domain-containing protein
MAIRTRQGWKLLDTRARALRRQLPLALEGDVTGVHHARVASRRLREAIPVLASGLKGAKSRKATRKVRRLTRALGAVRELDVTLGLLDELAQGPEIPRAAIEEVHAHVTAQRANHRQAMLVKVEGVSPEKLTRRLQSVAEAVGGDTREHWRQLLAGRLAKRSKLLSEQVEKAGQLYAPEQLHRVRIATKKLRYALELAADARVAGAAALVSTLKRVQTTLGRLHDLQVLQSHVMAVQAEAAARTSIQEGLAALAGRIEEQCRILHGQYVRLAPKLLETSQIVRTNIAPALASRKRPLKMSLARRRPAAAAARS